MYSWEKVLFVLFIHSLSLNANVEPEHSEERVCEGEMVRRAKIQPNYPDYEYEAEGSQRFYDPIQKKCLTKVDEPCPETNAICAPNSECELRKSIFMLHRRCYCVDGVIANLQKTYCGTPAGFGEDCSDVPFYTACHPNERLSCHSNKCACEEPSNMVYNAEAKWCKSLANGKCRNNDDCVEDAYCYGGRCTCNHGTTKERRCYRGFQEECSTDKPCNDHKFLRCTDGFCNCKEPLQQFYENHDCAILVGGKCQKIKSEEQPKCVKNAVCVDGVCECGGGFSATLYGVCHPALKDRGETCEPEQCDFNKGLACVDGVCQCLDTVLTYDNVTKSCVAAVGMKCGLVDKVDNRNCENIGKPGKDCPHYYISCERGLPCLQKATTGESFCSYN